MDLRASTVSILLIAAIAWSAAVAQDSPPADDASGITITRDQEQSLAHVRVAARNGRVAWADVLCGLARARGFDDRALIGVLPDTSFNLSHRRTRLLLAGMNLALRDNIHLHVESPAAEGVEPVLVVTLDRAALLATQRRFKQRLRQALAFAFRRQQGSKFSAELDEDWADTPVENNLVLLVHGLHSAPESVDEILPEIRRLGLACGVMRYPNDQPLVDSARLLSAALKQIATQQPERRVSLITCSMGGLVARAAVEDPELDPGNVDHLIMVAPPTHGSSLARFAFALEIWEYIDNEDQRRAVRRLYQGIEDGLGEAGDDLQPGSPFLETLNARQRNPKVRYAIFLGTGGYLTDAMLDSLRKRLEAAGARHRFVQFFGPKLDEYLQDMDEVVRGKGDGAVALTRGRLEGVDDTVVLGFDHLTMYSNTNDGASRALRAAILERLEADP